jgi:hypothetical protein
MGGTRAQQPTAAPRAPAPTAHHPQSKPPRPPPPHLGGAPARRRQLLDVLQGGVQVHLVLGARLPALVLRLEVLAWRWGCCGGGEGRQGSAGSRALPLQGPRAPPAAAFTAPHPTRPAPIVSSALAGCMLRGSTQHSSRAQGEILTTSGGSTPMLRHSTWRGGGGRRGGGDVGRRTATPAPAGLASASAAAVLLLLPLPAPAQLLPPPPPHGPAPTSATAVVLSFSFCRHLFTTITERPAPRASAAAPSPASWRSCGPGRGRARVGVGRGGWRLPPPGRSGAGRRARRRARCAAHRCRPARRAACPAAAGGLHRRPRSGAPQAGAPASAPRDRARRRRRRDPPPGRRAPPGARTWQKSRTPSRPEVLAPSLAAWGGRCAGETSTGAV